MEAATFLSEFGHLADAPGGIAKLRETILQLAVMGKLVEQDEMDEPVSLLLGSIDSERRNVCERLKNQEEPEAGTGNLKPIPYVPSHWVVVPLTRVFYSISTGSNKLKTKEYKEQGMIPIVDQGQKFIAGYTDDVSKVIRIPGPVIVFGDHTRAIKLVNFVFTAGADGIKILKPIIIVPEYFTYVLKSYELDDRGYGRHFRVLLSQQFPLPPLAEQHRIVAKVDELLALCDELQRKQERRSEVRTTLTRSVWTSVTQAPSPSEFSAAWHRAASEFDPLTQTPSSIGELRQTILQLAVMGKLVEQDEKDEPAEELLKRIAHAAQNRKSSRTSDVDTTRQVQCSFAVPSNWVIARFGDVVINRDGERIPVSKEIRAGRKGQYDYYGASGVIDKIDEYLFDKPLLLIGEDGANLINRSTPIAFIAHGKYWVNNHAHVLDGITFDFLKYLELYINAIDLKPYVTGSAQPKMNQAKMNSIPIPIPPEAEQKRIVAKVNHLLGLCDALEAKLTAAQAGAEKLLASLVREVLASAGA